jgi:hypothetical protein
MNPLKPEDIQVGDIVLKKSIGGFMTFKIKTINKDSITLDNDNIIGTSILNNDIGNYYTYFVYSLKDYQEYKNKKLQNCFYKNHEKTLNKSVEKSLLTEYNLYKINWNLDDDELYDFELNKFITDVIISAKTPEEALENVKKIGAWEDIDDAFMWQDEKYLVCELIGRSYLSNNGIIAYQRHNKYE